MREEEGGGGGRLRKEEEQEGGGRMREEEEGEGGRMKREEEQGGGGRRRRRKDEGGGGRMRRGGRHRPRLTGTTRNTHMRANDLDLRGEEGLRLNSLLSERSVHNFRADETTEYKKSSKKRRMERTKVYVTHSTLFSVYNKG